jgi:hypothetical protein
MSDNAPYNIPKAPGRWRAITLALVMHVALFLFFWIGIRWQSETPLTVEAEIWDPQYKEAAPCPRRPSPNRNRWWHAAAATATPARTQTRRPQGGRRAQARQA